MFGQRWPINDMAIPEGPFVPGDVYQRHFGGVQERYWLSTSGAALLVPDDVRLWLLKVGQRLCFKAKRTGLPYRPRTTAEDSRPLLAYSLCVSSDVRTTHQHVVRSFLRLPSDIPDERLFRQPIWSTWAQFKRFINASVVVDFAADILANNFTASQVEIDDDWTPRYGDLAFDPDRFPEPRAMVRQLQQSGHRVTVWVHPFLNNDSKAFTELEERQRAGGEALLVTNGTEGGVGLTRWWRGDQAATYDVTASGGRADFLRRLSDLQAATGIDSFKFDAGEVSWLPAVFGLAANRSRLNPALFTEAYARTAHAADPERRLQEVRVGYRTQDLPIAVRMMDKDSRWGHDNGLRAVLTVSLTFGILGYPFVLPDMIGGNGYCSGTDEMDRTCYPPAELYLRWLQLSAFLPIMQFSFPPWHYNDSVTDAARHLVGLHEQLAERYFIPLARRACTEPAPIIRPLWWLDPHNVEAHPIDDEFLIGDQVLVAPVMDEGARSRDVYVPSGTWTLNHTGESFEGPRWLREVDAPLEVIPYFLRET